MNDPARSTRRSRTIAPALPALLGALVATCLGGRPATAAVRSDSTPDMTADSVMSTKDGTTHRGKVYFAGSRVRSETDVGGKKIVTIVDKDQRRMWMVAPQFGCVKQPLKEDPRDPTTWAPETTLQEERLGTETIEGHPTEKFRTQTTIGGRRFVNFQWRATDLGGFPIQMTNEDGSWKMRYTDIRLATPDPKLLEPPKDCREATAGMLGSARKRPRERSSSR